MATLIATLVPASAHAATTALEPVADAYVSAAKPRANFGREPSLRLGGSERARGYLRFEVAVERPITRAVLELRSRSGKLRGLKVGTAAGGWSERKITFRKSPRARMGRATARTAAVGRLDVSSLVRKQGRVTLVVTGPKTSSLAVGSREARAASSRPRLVLVTEDPGAIPTPPFPSPLPQPQPQQQPQPANGQPQVKVRLLTVTPPPRTNDLVIAEVESSDPDGDALTHSYQWRKRPRGADLSVDLPFAQGNALNLGVTDFGDKGDSISVRVTAHDGTSSSAPVTSEEVVVADSPPTCSARDLATDEDTPKAIGPSCTDADGDALTHSVVGQGSKGTASVVGGELRYVPAANATGSDSFTYRASGDGVGGVPATVSVSIAAVDDAPVCAPVSLGTDEDTEKAVAPSCSDVEGDALTYSVVGQGSKGTASVVGGELHYVPHANATGSDSFTYRASANGKQSTPATVAVAVAAVDDAPTCGPVSLSTDEDTEKSVKPDCSDVEGDALSYAIVGQGTRGTASVVAGDLRYVPAQDVNGNDAFTYRASANGKPSTTATASVDIAAVNDAPSCVAKALTVEEDGEGSVAPQCSDVEGHDFTVEVAAQGSKGLATVTDSRLRYVPTANATGADFFTYRARDAAAGSPARVDVTVTPVNDAPTCKDVTLSTGEDVAGGVTADCEDLDGDPLTYAIVGAPAHGDASVEGSTLRYAPDPDFGGTDEFSYRALDGSVASDPAQVDVSVSAANDPPVIDFVEIDPTSPRTKDTLIASAAVDDPDGDTLRLTYEWLNGDATLLGETDDTLDLSKPGNGDKDDEIRVRVTAHDASSSSEPVMSEPATIENSPPVVDSVAVPEDAPKTNDLLSVSVEGHDDDGDAIAETTYQWRKGGADLVGETGPTLDLSEPGNGDRGDEIAVRVTVSDGSDAGEPVTSDQRTVRNSAPTLGAVTIVQDSPRTNDVLTVDAPSADADGDARTLTHQWRKNGSAIPGATGPTLNLATAGNGDRDDVITVQVTASDGHGGTSPAVTSPGRTIVNSAPVVEDVTIGVDEGSSGRTFDLTAADIDGDALQRTLVTEPAHGTLHDGVSASEPSIGAGDPVSGAQVTYVPDAGYTGADGFTYEASDGRGGVSSDGSVSISVNPVDVNSAPVCSGATLTVAEDTPGELSPCTDSDGDPLTLTVLSSPAAAKGALTAAPDGKLRYVPKPNLNGSDGPFTFKATDGEAESATATLSVTITEVNDPPTLGDDQAVAQENGASAVLDVDDNNNDKAGPSNEGGQDLVMTDVTDPPHGRAFLTDEVDDVNYNADDNYNGQDSFQYTLCDDGTTAGAPDPKCSTATVYVTVARFVAPTVETAPIPHLGTSFTDDAADDTAIWVDPADPAASTIIGTNKFKGGPGLLVYDLDGTQLQALEAGRQMNNVDLRDGVPYNGGTVSLVAASDRTGGGFRLAFYTVDPSTGLLDQTAIGTIPLTFEPYGLCLYKPGSGPMSVYVTRDNSSVGRMDQYQLSISPTDTAFGATFLRTVNVGSLSEGCVADDHHGVLYVGEEDRGIWRYNAATPSNTTRARVDVTGPGENLRADVEGLAIAPPSGPDDGSGHLIASSQGNHTFTVYDRNPASNAFVRSVDVVPNFDLGIDGVEDTDGIEVSSAALPGFDGGVFIAQDFRNQEPGDDEDAGANQNFKLTPLAPFFAPPSLDP